MPIHFANSGLIDLDVIRTMGVSVKDNANPIGYFGTGLKYAIATLLRTGHKVQLQRGDELIQFTTKPKLIRGQEFLIVHMNDEPLAFTLDYGKNWHVWQAYRELHSNTLDELGQISDKPLTGDTVFTVGGAAIEDAYHNRHEIFLSSEPLETIDTLEIHPKPSRYIYYRGVRVGEFQDKCAFTYNFNSGVRLTEDRTVNNMVITQMRIERLLAESENDEVISKLTEGTNYHDQEFDFASCSYPSEKFLRAAEARYHDATANDSLRKLVDRHNNAKGLIPLYVPNPNEESLIRRALKLLTPLCCSLNRDGFKIAADLGVGVFGVYHTKTDQIYLSRSVLDWGAETIAATLYEEWLHKEHRLSDCSRELQNFLLQRLITVTNQ